MTSHASFWEAVKGALHSLRGSKLRSFLTLLGIILATTTLIAVMSVISGMDVYIASNVSSMGADGYRVQRIVMMGFDPKKYLEMLRRNPVLTREEYEFLRRNVTLTSQIGAATGRGANVHMGKETIEAVGLQGVTPNMGVITNVDAEEGHFISDIENARHMNVVFVGHDVKDKLFPAATAGEQTITLDGIPFKVVGVAKAKGSVFGQSQDNFVMIPIETFFKIWGARNGMSFAATAIDHQHLLQAQEEARVLLRTFRHLGPKQDDTF